MAKRTCSTAGCEGAHYSKDMCKPCYRRDYYQRNGDHERATMKAWREQNAQYDRERWATWYAANRATLLPRKRAKWAADPVARERKAARDRLRPDRYKKWRKANPERWALLNRENSRRRHRCEGRVSYAAILVRDGMACHLCGREIPSMDVLHFDHVIPLSRGGPHSMANIKPAHARCNLRKFNKLMEELAP